MSWCFTYGKIPTTALSSGRLQEASCPGANRVYYKHLALSWCSFVFDKMKIYVVILWLFHWSSVCWLVFISVLPKLCSRVLHVRACLQYSRAQCHCMSRVYTASFSVLSGKQSFSDIFSEQQLYRTSSRLRSLFFQLSIASHKRE